MTRFQIVGIFEDKILTAGEFNGDGYFEGGHGEEICAAFSNIKTEKEYRKIVGDINNEYFEYDEELIYPVRSIEDLNFYRLKQKHLYYDIWFSDYLYIINLSGRNQTIVDENHTNIILYPGGWVTINFGELYVQDDPNSEIQCCGKYEIDRFEWFENICEEQNWIARKENNIIELTKCSPAGEDLCFSIDADDDLQRQVEELAYDFDVDEHVKMWINSSLNGTPSVRELLEDAEWIKDALENLAIALKD